MDVRALWIWSPSWWCSSLADNGLVNWDSLLLHSESPGYCGRVFSNYCFCFGEVILMWFCELFVESGDGIFPASWWFSWPKTGATRVVFDFSFATQFHFHTESCFLCLTHRLSLGLQFTPSDSQKRSPCLCAGCLVARSPSRFSDIVVVCLYWLECVTCICVASLEGVCFCSQCCKQGGAPFPNHSVGDGYFHRSYFFNHFGQ